MKRCLAALLTSALIAFGQHPRTLQPPPQPTPRPSTRFVDVVVLDAAGRPVPGLSAEDFEVVRSGQSRNITQSTWFDARRHTALAHAMPSLAEPVSLELVPDEIHRNFIAIVDDLGLPAAGIDAVQNALRKFLTEQMGSGERMAVLRTSSGSGDLQQLTGDRRILAAAIDRIQFLGAHIAERTAADACWLTLRHALAGLNHLPGRKFVVLFSENLRAPGTRHPAGEDLSIDANAGMAAVYAIDPRGAVAPDPTSKNLAPLEALARGTSGVFGAELCGVLQAEEGFYVLGFEEPSSDLVVERTWEDRSWNGPVTVKVRREGVTVRPRFGFPNIESQEDFLAPADRTVQIRRALASPYEGADIHTRLTATFSTFAGQDASVEVAVLIDAHDLGVIRDAKSRYHGAVRMTIDASSAEFGSVAPTERSYDFVMSPEEHERALRDGLLYTVILRLPAAGAWRIRALVADGIGDRMGAFTQSIEIPARNTLSLSGLTLRGYYPSDGRDTAIDPQENAAVRIFKTGRTVEYIYYIFDPVADGNKQSKLEIASRIYTRGRRAYAGTPSQLVYPTQQGTRRQVAAGIILPASMAPGDYILEVTVTDKLAPAGAPRIASRFIDFQLRH